MHSNHHVISIYANKVYRKHEAFVFWKANIHLIVIRQAADVRRIFGMWDWKKTKPVTEYVAKGQQIRKCR